MVTLRLPGSATKAWIEGEEAMIREVLIGAALLGGGGYYAMTMSTSATVVRTVKATPHETWRPFDLIFNQSQAELAAFGREGVASDGSRVTVPVMTSVPGREVSFRIDKNGKEAIRVHLGFEPIADGGQTRMTVQVDLAPGFVPANKSLGSSGTLKRGIEKMIDHLIPQIESGKLIKSVEAIADIRRMMVAHPDAPERRVQHDEYARREAQEAASRPMLDPDAAAMDPKGASAAPSRGARTY
jgi:hypothetical protein